MLQLKGSQMKILSALIGAGLVVGVATAGIAQTTTPTTNPNTKVYAYQKKAPQAQGANPATASTAMTPHVTEQVPPTHGTPRGTPQRWWDVMDRSSGGGSE